MSIIQTTEFGPVDESKLCLKFLSSKNYSGVSHNNYARGTKWTPGVWNPNGVLNGTNTDDLCNSGFYHAYADSTSIALLNFTRGGHMNSATMNKLWVAEYRGIYRVECDKMGATEMRILYPWSRRRFRDDTWLDYAVRSFLKDRRHILHIDWSFFADLLQCYIDDDEDTDYIVRDLVKDWQLSGIKNDSH